MNKLIALVAVLGFAGSANAADGADFSHSGEFRLRYVNDMNKDMNDNGGGDSTDQNYSQRLRWGTDVRAGENLTGHFTLVHNANWGENVGFTSATNQVPAPTATGINQLTVNEAYMTWMLSDAWMVRAGRGTFTMGDGRFVSSNDYEAVSKAFDGVLATWDQEMARISFFAVQGANFTEANAQGNFFGFSADMKSLPDFLKTASLHVVQVKRDRTVDMPTAALDATKQDNMKAGISVSGDMAGVDYRVNYEMEKGEDDNNTTTPSTKTDISTSMIDAEVGYTIAAAMNTRVHVGYHTDSGTAASVTNGDDETYDGFHYDTHNNAGLMDIFQWGNLTYMRVGFALNPTDDITVAAEYFMFTQTEKDGATTKSFTATGSATEDDLGTELDLTVTKKYTNNFKIAGSYRMFTPGDEWKAVAAGGLEDNYNQLLFTSTLTF